MCVEVVGCVCAPPAVAAAPRERLSWAGVDVPEAVVDVLVDSEVTVDEGAVAAVALPPFGLPRVAFIRTDWKIFMKF